MAACSSYGKGTALSNVVTVTLSADPHGDVHAVVAMSEPGAGPGAGAHAITSITDSKGGTWPLVPGASYLAMIGLTWEAQTPDIPLGLYGVGIEVGSFVRTAGDPLAAGDTVTVTWETEVSECSAIIVGVTGCDTLAEDSDQGPPVAYGNGDTGEGSFTTISWNADLGPSFVPTPNADCAMISACVVLPSAAPGSPAMAGYTPTEGAAVDEILSAGNDYTLAVAFLPLASSSTAHEPGGTWPETGSLFAANYQFIQIPTGATGFAIY